MQIRMISDVEELREVQNDQIKIDKIKYRKNDHLFMRVMRLFLISFHYDYLLLNFSVDIFLLGLLRFCFPYRPCRLGILDLFLPPPKTSLLEKIKKFIRTTAIKGMDVIFLYSKNNERLCKTYKIDPRKLVYVPFKINSYDYVMSQETSDGGYIFSGGRSRRDYKTLIDAAKDLPFPVKIVTPPEKTRKMQGTFLDEHSLPPNVEVINDDGSIESFVSYIANSRLVVLPLRADDFASTGTSVYLLSMALKKSVIISSGPTTDGILTEHTAVIVPPEDPRLLRCALEKVFYDEVYRKKIGENGYQYAINLGDERRLHDSIISEIMADSRKRRG